MKLSNALLAALLLLAALAWLLAGTASPGGAAALLLPAVTFAASHAAMRRRTSGLFSVSLWLNALLLAAYLLVDVLALFVLRVPMRNAIPIVAFQALLVALPAVANIVALRRLRQRNLNSNLPAR